MPNGPHFDWLYSGWKGMRQAACTTPARAVANETKGAFRLSELTGQTIPVAMEISLLIKTI